MEDRITAIHESIAILSDELRGLGYTMTADQLDEALSFVGDAGTQFFIEDHSNAS